ncbi:hypothetical protein LQZ19_17160 [Treponema primitia]|uniref:hypothetical protein n=1 Tax=Treponema primitia TaxID=88058 RepID=UPI003980581B
MRRLVLAAPVMALIFLMSSCPTDSGDSGTKNPYSGLASRQFWAQDMSTPESNYYTLNAVKLAEGQRCIVWAEKNAEVSVDTGKAIAKEYDNNIYSRITNLFGSDELMNFGDVDNNGKFTLLLLDIKDGYSSPGGAYTAGYFGSADLFSGTNSNKADMIYVDTYPSKLGSPESYATIAHELQHFINYVTSQKKRPYLMDTWIDEGLSTAAEYIYLGGHDMSRVNRFIYSQTIAQGNNFFVWGEDKNVVLDEYSTAYLFFQWLRLQSGGTGIYRDIITSNYYDYRAVIGAITGAFAAGLGTKTWENVLRTWFAANYINSANGIYGYKGDLPTVRVWAIGGSTKYLLPGEGVYSVVGAASGTLPSGGGSHIKYAGLGKTPSPSVSVFTFPANGRLLTFNALDDWNQYAKDNYINTVEGLRETGKLTGGAAETIPSASIAGNGRQAWRQPDSWVIDARDILGRREREETAPIKLWSQDNGAE